MKVTGIRTVRVPEHPQMLWLEVLTDEGISGLGETCLGPATVEAYLHETVAPYLTGQDPLRIAAHRRGLYDMFVGYEGTGAETRGNSAVDVALWDILGQATGRPVVDLLGGRTRDSIRISPAGRTFFCRARSWACGRPRFSASSTRSSTFRESPNSSTRPSSATRAA